MVSAVLHPAVPVGGRELPLTSFERFKTGTYRKMCWQCRWVLNGKGVRKRSLLRHETA